MAGESIQGEPPEELVVPGGHDSDGALYCGSVGVAKYVMPDGQVRYREYWSREISMPEGIGLTISLADTLRQLLLGSRRDTDD